MENLISIPKGVVEVLLAFGEDTEYESVKDELGDQWRWGYWHKLIIKDSQGNYWAHDYQEQAGDHYWNSISGDGFGGSDDARIEFYRVEPIEVVTMEYRKVNG